MAPDGERIIGGVPTSDFPDCVAVGSNTGWCCSGTLVAPNVVVTAGHCHAECASRVLIGDDVAGEAEAQVIAVAHAKLHPNYSRGKHDLGTLILAKDAEGVHPRGIAKPDALDGATSVRIAGFGNTSVYGGYGRRMMVDVPLAGNDPRFGADPAKEFVAGSPFLDRDSCNGDSGGPAYVQVDGGWQLAGATSRATDSRFRLCGDGGIYTRVRVYNDWITAVPGCLASGRDRPAALLHDERDDHHRCAEEDEGQAEPVALVDLVEERVDLLEDLADVHDRPVGALARLRAAASRTGVVEADDQEIEADGGDHGAGDEKESGHGASLSFLVRARTAERLQAQHQVADGGRL